MRPSFSYLDKADNKSREREAANEGGLEINLLNPESKRDLASQAGPGSFISWICVLRPQVAIPPRMRPRRRPRPSR